MFKHINNNNNKEALISEKKTYTFNEINCIKSQISNLIKAREIVLIRCSNQIDCVAGYLSFIESGLIPILVEENISNEFCKNVIENYRIKYIFEKLTKETKYKEVIRIGDYAVYEMEKESTAEKLDKQIGQLLLTSGSSGDPKCVVHSLENISTNMHSISKYLKLSSSDISITNLPFNYTYGLSIITSHIHVGGKIYVTNNSFLSKKFWQEIEHNNVTNFNGVPYVYDTLVDRQLINHLMKNENIRFITQAGGKLRSRRQAFIGELSKKNNKKFFIMYGQTEATARISYLEPDKVLNKIGSIGHAIDGGHLSIIDEKNEYIKEPYRIGELLYEGPNVSMGYSFHFDDLIDREKRDKLLTGDLGYFDEDEDFFLTGRKSRFVKIFGVRVSLDAIESFIHRFDEESLCTGIDDMLIIISNLTNQRKLKKEITLNFDISMNGIYIIDNISVPRLISGKIDYEGLIEKSLNIIESK